MTGGKDLMKSDIILTRVQTGHRDAEEKRKRMTAKG